jgi:hypothetical protein
MIVRTLNKVPRVCNSLEIVANDLQLTSIDTNAKRLSTYPSSLPHGIGMLKLAPTYEMCIPLEQYYKPLRHPSALRGPRPKCVTGVARSDDMLPAGQQRGRRGDGSSLRCGEHCRS